MKFRRLAVLSCFLSLTALGGVAFSFGQTKKIMESEAALGSYDRNKATYYTSAFSHKVTSSMYDDTLLSTLNGLMQDSHKSYNTYDELFTVTKYSDVDLDNPDNIILLYSRQSINGERNVDIWNREHVWCQSKASFSTGTGAGSDLHHLRPASSIYNSTRNNIPYGVITNKATATQMGDTDCYYTKYVFDPADYIKGDVARVLMYLYTHYSENIDSSFTYKETLNITDIVVTSSNTAQASWDLLMEWNEADPVDYREMVRNNVAASYLGNFNPFIDHPEYARMIWDDTASVQAGLSFPVSYKEINVNATFTNAASAVGNVSSTGTIVYTSDNPSVASVSSSGVVTGVSNGVARIKARGTVNGVNKISYFFVKVGSGYTPKRTLDADGIIYTPTSTSTAVASEKIASETVSYTNSYKTSQITKDNSLTMTITNFPRTISALKLYMRSNGSAGSGTINVTVGGSSYYSRSGTFAQIYGSYSTSFVPVDVTNASATKKTGTIVINITCSVNSLYLQKVIVDYSERTVTKATGITVYPSSKTIAPGEDIDMLTLFTPTTTSLQTVTWTSSNTNVATVTRFGVVTGKAVGSATITATTMDGSNKSNTAAITVSNTVPGDDSGPAVLSSISLNTDNVKKNFVKGESFTYAGLVVTAHYSDSTSQTVASGYTVSPPNMSTTGNKTVTVTYSGYSAQYTITVTAQATSISASVSKIYHPGDVITTADITVVDNLENVIEGFTFSENDHKFTYQEAASGGALTNKTFTNSISYNNMTCSLTVQVKRNAYEEAGTVTDIITRELTGVTGSNSYTNWSDKTSNSSAVYAGHSARYSTNSSDAIQLRSTKTDSTYNAGIVSTTSGGTLTKVKITWNSGTANTRTLNVYGKNSAYSSPNDLYSNVSSTKGTLLGTIVKGTSTEITIDDTYTYVGLCSASGAMYIDKVEITYGAEETALNVANYIMINDTEGQCSGQNGKYNLSIAKLNTMSKDEKDLFWGATESQNYVIYTARTRLAAWARHEGKTLSYIDETFSSNSNTISILGDTVMGDPTIYVVVGITLASVLGFATYFIYRKKKQD